MHEHWLNHWLLLYWREFIDSDHSDSNQRDSSDSCWFLCYLNWRDSKLHHFCAQLFQLQNYSRDHHFRKCCCLQGFHFHFFIFHVTTYFCQRDPTSFYQRGRISWWNSITAIIPDTNITLNSSTTLHTVNLRCFALGSSWWVHRNTVFRFPPKTNTHVVTTLMTPEGEFPITVSPSINESARLVLWMSVSSNRALLFARSSDPIVIVENKTFSIPAQLVFAKLIRRRLLSSIFPKWSGKWWCW